VKFVNVIQVTVVGLALIACSSTATTAQLASAADVARCKPLGEVVAAQTVALQEEATPPKRRRTSCWKVRARVAKSKAKCTSARTTVRRRTPIIRARASERGQNPAHPLDGRHRVRRHCSRDAARAATVYTAMRRCSTLPSDRSTTTTARRTRSSRARAMAWSTARSFVQSQSMSRRVTPLADTSHR